MKCSQCGHWNKDSFPRCFHCGAPLTHASEDSSPAWLDKLQQPPAPKIYQVFDAEEQPDPAEPASKEPESLAEEMVHLKERRQRGEGYLAALRQHAATQGIAPSGSSVRTDTPNDFFADIPDDPEETLYEPAEVRRRRKQSRSPDDLPSDLLEDWEGVGDEEGMHYIEEDLPPMEGQAQTLPLHRRSKRARRNQLPAQAHQRKPFLAARMLVVFLVVITLTFIGYQGILFATSHKNQAATQTSASLSYEIEQAIIKDQPGHIITIPGQEGTQIYISELKKSYIVAGGIATIAVPDYVFYETVSNLEAPTMDVTLTPSIIYAISGEQKLMDAIRYTIDIPLSSIELIQPESLRTEVSTSVCTLKLRITAGSRVIINGQDVSDTINADGIITHNPPVRAIGDNIVSISVTTKYCRQNNMTLTLYRAPQEIPLELAADTEASFSKQDMLIFASTLPGATVAIETPFSELDTSNLSSTGNFSFKAKLSQIGDNIIRIRSTYPDKADSVLEHVVYYLPPASIYTPLAWTLNSFDYQELLSNIHRRVGQIYRCKGTITKILSDKPQLAIMDTGKDGNAQLVMLENNCKTKWEEGKVYRVYADVSGMYDVMPRLIARYTYTD